MRTSTTTPSANPAATTGWRGWQATTETRACDFAISFGWTAGGEFLATSGSEQLILWPFDGKDGPMGKEPRLMAQSPARVSVVACHPRQSVVAVGYADGAVILVRIDDGALLQAKPPGKSAVSALGWDGSGQMLGFGTEAGEAGVLN